MASDEIRERRRVIVHGRVQGVWFRGSTEAEAHRIGVDGWVRNLPNGTVEAVFEGTRAAVEAAVRFCEQGPSYAKVVRVEKFEEAPEALRGFSVCYD
jgi:acylphosphatase